MNADRVKQREWAVEMYGDPKKQTSWLAKANSWFAIYEEMKRDPSDTQSTYVLYKVKQMKEHRTELLSLPGAIIEKRTLERLAG